MKRVKEKRTITNKETIADNPYVNVEYCNSIFRKYIYAKGLEGGKQGDGSMLGVSPDGQYFMLKAYNDKYVMQAGNKEGGRFVPSYEWQGISTYEFNKDFEDLTGLFGFPENFGMDDIITEEDIVENKKRGNMKRVKEMARVVRSEQFDMDYCADSFTEVMNGNLHDYGVEAGVCPGNANLSNENLRKFYLKYPTADGKEDTIFFTCKLINGGYRLEDSPMNGAKHLFDAFECPPKTAAQNSPKAVRGFYFNDVIDLADDIMNYFYEKGVPCNDEEDLEESIKRSRKASKKVQEMARVNRASMVNVKNLIQHFKDICDDSFSFKCQANNTVQGARFELTHPDTDAHIVISLTFDPDTKEYSLDDSNEEFDEFTGSLAKGFDDFDADVEDLLNDISYAEMCKDPEYRKEMGLDESKKNKKKSLKERHVGENAKQFEDPNEAFDTWFSFCDAWMVESMINEDDDYDYENDPEDLIYPQVAEKGDVKIFFNAMWNEDENGIEYYIRVENREGELLDEYTSEFGSADELEGDLRRIEHDYIEE